MPPKLQNLGISLVHANKIASKAIEKARQLEMQPVAVAVLNAAGQTKALQVEDGASHLRADIAVAKAWGSLGMGHSGRGQFEFSQKMPQLYQSFVGISDYRMVPAPGGLFVLEGNEIIGAVGVSGDLPDKDEQCAVAGVSAAGFSTDAQGQ